MICQRQLVILHELLNSPDGTTLRTPEETVVNRAWRRGDAMNNSTVTLPSEESTPASLQGGGRVGSSPTKKRSASGMGMSGLREMLRVLKRSHPELPAPLPPPPTVTSTSDTLASAELSIGDGHGRYQHYHAHPQILTQRRRAKTSIGPESINSVRQQNENQAVPYKPLWLTHNSSRRPSLASNFRLGQKCKSTLSCLVPLCGSHRWKFHKDQWAMHTYVYRSRKC
jgi:serine/arginine repetitive matrix protein 2